MRNQEKDAREMAERKERMLDVGFELFSQHTIESVSMSDIAGACGLGIATLYRYFPSKLDLVIAISAKKWRQIDGEIAEQIVRNNIGSKTAVEQFGFCLDCYIMMFKKYKSFLRFNYDFNLYISDTHATASQLRENSEAVATMASRFHSVWEHALTDRTVRTEGLSERELFYSSMHIMLATASRYATGLLYRVSSEEDDVRELNMLKKMIMSEFAAGKPAHTA